MIDHHGDYPFAMCERTLSVMNADNTANAVIRIRSDLLVESRFARMLEQTSRRNADDDAVLRLMQDLTPPRRAAGKVQTVSRP
jgi:hypothetical protein